MAPPLTLEQVLARSMRMAAPAVKAAATAAATAAPTPMVAPPTASSSGSRHSKPPQAPPAASDRSSSSTTTASDRAANHTVNSSTAQYQEAPSDWGSITSSQPVVTNRELSSVFGVVEGKWRRSTQEEVLLGMQRELREEKERGVKDLFLSARLRRQSEGAQAVHNHMDLASFLQASQRLQQWEEGLDAFCHAVEIPASLSTLVRGGSAAPTSTNVVQKAAPSPQVLRLVLDMCAQAERYEAVKALGVYCGRRFPFILLQSVQLLVKHYTQVKGGSNSEAAKEPRWQVELLDYLRLSGIPPSEISVDVFNAILSGCEGTRDYKGALYILQSMGPNPLSAPFRVEAEEDGSVTSEDEFPPPASWTASPVSPNVVSYATLIAALEQSGRAKAASRVVSLLPQVEKKEITASYAALIYLWSNQVQTRHRRKW